MFWSLLAATAIFLEHQRLDQNWGCRHLTNIVMLIEETGLKKLVGRRLVINEAVLLGFLSLLERQSLFFINSSHL